LGPIYTCGTGGPDATIRSRTSVTDRKWHHVAATRENSTGKMRLYVDGTLEAEGNGSPGTRRAPPRIVMGRLQTDCNFFAGRLDDVRFYSRALAEDEVRFLFQDRASR
jgi:hypothetical protein